MAYVSKDKRTGQPVLRNAKGEIVSRHATHGAAVQARDEALCQHNREKSTQGRSKQP